MRIVIAPNAFKGSLTSRQAAAAMAQGVRRVLPEAAIVEVPVADGGDGLVDIAIETLGGRARTVTVTGPDYEPVAAAFCYVPEMRFAAIEMALASGLALLADDRRNPMTATTQGTGQLIRAALELDVTHVAVGIGGSATNDGGIGMAAALGVRFLDGAGNDVAPIAANLARIRRIDLSQRLHGVAHVRFEAVCDVDNPLCGERGASAVYGPQKGATPEQVAKLDAGLANLAAVIKHDLGVDVIDLPGAGAAGGLGAGLCAFLGAELRRGVDVILELVGLPQKLAGAQLVLTGEGRIDRQTAFGKAPAGVAAAARARDIPCIAIAGSVGDGLGDLHAMGIDAVFSLCPGPIALADAMADGARYLAAATEQAVRGFLAGRTDRAGGTAALT
ncbi:MAG: glycerate kinase [Defluviicoccus sp.]|nr:glycerate kinase [Defluviicoccus sp.]MDG4608242.1 glycerate kinase [Defluviicoccus sp.]